MNNHNNSAVCGYNNVNNSTYNIDSNTHGNAVNDHKSNFLNNNVERTGGYNMAKNNQVLVKTDGDHLSQKLHTSAKFDKGYTKFLNDIRSPGQNPFGFDFNSRKTHYSRIKVREKQKIERCKIKIDFKRRIHSLDHKNPHKTKYRSRSKA